MQAEFGVAPHVLKLLKAGTKAGTAHDKMKSTALDWRLHLNADETQK